MWPLVIIGAGAWLVREIVKELGWTRDWSKNDIDSLPESPGTYILYNKQKNIIHIGSTEDLHRRISKHEKRNKFHSIDFMELKSSNLAYEMEMKLHKKYNYKGR